MGPNMNGVQAALLVFFWELSWVHNGSWTFVEEGWGGGLLIIWIKSYLYVKMR